MLILDDRYHWQICEKGHSTLYIPGQPYEACKMCNRKMVSTGIVDENSMHPDKQWEHYESTTRKVREAWIAANGDDGEIFCWDEGTIVTHRDCGGLGVICTVPEDEYEPPQQYVRWVVIPDWSLPTKESCPKSVWVGDRNSYFKKANAIHRSDVVS